MKTTIRTIINENIGKYKYMGIRGTYEPHEVNEILETSYDWDHDNDISTFETDDPIELGGVCCINLTHDDYEYDWIETEEEMEDVINYMLDQIEFATGGYSYPHFCIVVSNDWNPLNMYENDEHEIILADAKVIKIIK